jgi:hypothetical protein
MESDPRNHWKLDAVPENLPRTGLFTIKNPVSGIYAGLPHRQSFVMGFPRHDTKSEVSTDPRTTPNDLWKSPFSGLSPR